MTAPSIDLNCDLGEGVGDDVELLPLISSANIACGGHAGDRITMHTTVAMAWNHRVAIGAHPSFPDREHFGRLEQVRSEHEVYADCLSQCGPLLAFARRIGVPVRHLKPHGALYHQACRDEQYARPLVAAAELLGLSLVGLPGSVLERLSRGRCRFLAEGFADRRTLPDGSLVPRSQPDAVIDDPAEAVRQLQRLLNAKTVETICVHGDTPHAVAFVLALRAELDRIGIMVRAPA